MHANRYGHEAFPTKPRTPAEKGRGYPLLDARVACPQPGRLFGTGDRTFHLSDRLCQRGLRRLFDHRPPPAERSADIHHRLLVSALLVVHGAADLFRYRRSDRGPRGPRGGRGDLSPSGVRGGLPISRGRPAPQPDDNRRRDDRCRAASCDVGHAACSIPTCWPTACCSAISMWSWIPCCRKSRFAPCWAEPRPDWPTWARPTCSPSRSSICRRRC